MPWFSVRVAYRTLLNHRYVPSRIAPEDVKRMLAVLYSYFNMFDDSVLWRPTDGRIILS